MRPGGGGTGGSSEGAEQGGGLRSRSREEAGQGGEDGLAQTALGPSPGWGGVHARQGTPSHTC